MKCQNCDGNGRFEVEDNGVVMQGVYWRCPNCGGKGVVEPLTNEEWLEQASTEEKAKLLSKLCKFIYNCGKKGSIPKYMYEEDFVQWLKEKHE